MKSSALDYGGRGDVGGESEEGECENSGKGCEVPCWERGSGTFLRYRMKSLRALGAAWDGDILTSVSERIRGLTLPFLLHKKSRRVGTFLAMGRTFQIIN